MLSNFGNKFAEGLAGTWNARVLTPAFVFWVGGACIWGLTHDRDRQRLVADLTQLGIIEALFLVGAGLFLVVISNDLVTWMTPLLLRLAEGYWTGPFYRLRDHMVRRIRKQLALKEQTWEKLAADFDRHQLNPQMRETYARLDTELAAYPQPELLLPTRLGNILRAAEEYPALRYGLDTIVVWSRLWFLLPEDVQAEIAYARRSLDERIRLLAWGILFAIWSIWCGWIVFIALGFTRVVYVSSLAAAMVYGDMVRAAFDLYRFQLYESLHFPPPPSPEAEEDYGKALTKYLHRGELSHRGAVNVYIQFQSRPTEAKEQADD